MSRIFSTGGSVGCVSFCSDCWAVVVWFEGSVSLTGRKASWWCAAVPSGEPSAELNFLSGCRVLSEAMQTTDNKNAAATQAIEAIVFLKNVGGLGALLSEASSALPTR